MPTAQRRGRRGWRVNPSERRRDRRPSAAIPWPRGRVSLVVPGQDDAAHAPAVRILDQRAADDRRSNRAPAPTAARISPRSTSRRSARTWPACALAADGDAVLPSHIIPSTREAASSGAKRPAAAGKPLSSIHRVAAQFVSRESRAIDHQHAIRRAPGPSRLRCRPVPRQNDAETLNSSTPQLPTPNRRPRRQASYRTEHDGAIL